MAMKQAHLKAQKPTEEEVEIAEVFAVPDPVQTAEAQLPAELPQTASFFPLIGLVGLLSVVVALGLAAARVR